MLNFKSILVSLVVFFVGYYIFYLTTNSNTIKNNNAEYLKQILQKRKEKNDYFAADSLSPIENKNAFSGLKYFEIDSQMVTEASLDKLASGQTLQMPMTDGSSESYEAFANAHFKLKGVRCNVKIYKNAQGTLFFPFKDLTSGKTTYGGGRYIDLAFTKSDKLTIDFNLAYHPFCAYNHHYTCPVPPPENTLNIAVTAGEKL